MAGVGDLTQKQRAFVEEYLKDFNATRAAERAGYGGDDNVLAAQGSRLLKNVKVSELVKTRLSETVMTTDEILARISEQARSDISEFLKPGGAVDWEKVHEKGHLIKRITHQKGNQSTIELYGSDSALDKLCRAFGMFRERRDTLNIDLTQLTPEQLERIANGDDPIHVLATTGGGGT